MQKLTNNLRGFLADKQLSQTDLADLTGLTYPVIRRVTSPSANPPLEYALAISRALRISLDQLFHLDGMGQ